MKRLLLLLVLVQPCFASYDTDWLLASKDFDNPVGRVRKSEALEIAAPGGSKHGRISLSELAEKLSQDPAAMDDLVKALVSKLGDTGQAWATPERKVQLEQALRSADKEKLDRFPILTPVELLEAAQYLAAKQKPAAEDDIPKEQTLKLKGKPVDPAPDAFLKDLGHGLKHGDEPMVAQGSAYGDNEELAQVLNRLSLNDAQAPVYTLVYAGKRYQSVKGFLDALLQQGDHIEARDMRFFAQFGGLWYEHDGRRDEVLTPIFIDTGRKLPSGRALIVPVVHSHFEITIRGRVNADLVFYFGMDGAPAFRSRATMNKPWVGGRVVGRNEGTKTEEWMVKAAKMRKDMMALAKTTKLPLGGYGPLGDCNDVHAFITGKAPFPMLRNPKYFAGDSALDGLSNSMPYDLIAPPDTQRILDSMPYEDPRQIPFAEVREAILELQKD